MLKQFLKDIITIVVGKQAEDIAELLDNKKYVNEFLIAKKMDITINQTRNILYKLSDKGLVSSIRKKDKKKGWYTYFWKIEIIKSLEFLKDILTKNIEQIDNQIKSRETKDFYVCEKCNIEFNEENALLHNFTCNECGSIFSLKDNLKFIKELNRQRDKYNKELQNVQGELMTEKEKEDKKKQKEIIKEEKIRKEIKKKLAKKKKRIKNLEKGLKKRLFKTKKGIKKIITKKIKKKIRKIKIIKKGKKKNKKRK